MSTENTLEITPVKTGSSQAPVSEKLQERMPPVNPNRRKNLSFLVHLNILILNLQEIAEKLKRR